MDDVRRLSGASVGSIYHWFDGKEGIAAALYLEALRDYQRGYLAVLEREPDPERGIRGRGAPPPALGCRQSRPGPLPADQPRDGRGGAARAERARCSPPRPGGCGRTWRPARIQAIPLDLYYAVLIGPSQEFARHWLAGRMKSSIKNAERALGDAAWNALRAKGG